MLTHLDESRGAWISSVKATSQSGCRLCDRSEYLLYRVEVPTVVVVGKDQIPLRVSRSPPAGFLELIG